MGRRGGVVDEVRAQDEARFPAFAEVELPFAAYYVWPIQA